MSNIKNEMEKEDILQLFDYIHSEYSDFLSGVNYENLRKAIQDVDWKGMGVSFRGENRPLKEWISKLEKKVNSRLNSLDMISRCTIQFSYGINLNSIISIIQLSKSSEKFLEDENVLIMTLN
jgi:hypothetical protein